MTGKDMKKINLIIAILFAFLTGVFTACSSSDDDRELPTTPTSGIEGYWISLESIRQDVKDANQYAANPGSIHYGAYWSEGILSGNSNIYMWHFVNNNTVERVCYLVYKAPNNNAFYKETSTTFPFYLVEFSDRYMYTYSLIGNKIIISNGDIVTLLNGKLYWDGNSKQGFEKISGFKL